MAESEKVIKAIGTAGIPGKNGNADKPVPEGSC
jgi:hypothetical protein